MKLILLGLRLCSWLYFIGNMCHWLFFTFSWCFFFWLIVEGKTQIISFNISILFWNRTHDWTCMPLSSKVRGKYFIMHLLVIFLRYTNNCMITVFFIIKHYFNVMYFPTLPFLDWFPLEFMPFFSCSWDSRTGQEDKVIPPRTVTFAHWHSCSPEIRVIGNCEESFGWS